MFKKGFLSLVLLGLLGITTPVLALDNLELDGVLSEWTNAESLGVDGDDIIVANAKADILQAWASVDGNNLQIAYRNDGPIDDIWWPWQIFIDTDRNSETGFNRSTNNLGAEYMLQGDQLLRYTGNGISWDWESVRFNIGVKLDNNAELQIALSELGNPVAMNILFKASNSIFTGSFDNSGIDSFPNSGAGFLTINTQSFTDERSNALTPRLDGDLSDWSATTSFGRDGDDISVAGAQADILETWVANDRDNLYIAYTNDGPINFDTWWPWQVYFDTDNNANTGFQVDGIGADYILQGQSLSRYLGSGSEWQWEYITSAEHANNLNQVELRIPKSWLGNPETFKFVVKTRNEPFIDGYDAEAIDSLPNTGSYSYRMASNDGLVFSNYLPNVSSLYNFSQIDSSTLSKFGTDGIDTIFISGAKADLMEAWVAHDNDRLYVSYTNLERINVDTWWAWQVYLDTDNNPETGFQVSGIGADFVLQGNTLSRYTGSGSNWLWEDELSAEYIIPFTNSNVAYLRFPLDVLGNARDIKVSLIARNAPFTGSYDPSHVDVYKADGVTAFNYRLDAAE